MREPIRAFFIQARSIGEKFSYPSRSRSGVKKPRKKAATISIINASDFSSRELPKIKSSRR